MQFARHLLEYLAARTLVAILALLPAPFATRIAMVGSRLLFACLPRLRHIGLRNLELAFPDLSLTERRQLLEQSFENFGRIIADFAHFPHATPADLVARVETSFPKQLEARYHAAKATGRGVIFVTSHLGNWEMLALAGSTIFEPIAYLARPLDNPLLDRYTSRVRSCFGNRPINKRDSVLEGLAILDAGGPTRFARRSGSTDLQLRTTRRARRRLTRREPDEQHHSQHRPVSRLHRTSLLVRMAVDSSDLMAGNMISSAAYAF